MRRGPYSAMDYNQETVTAFDRSAATYAEKYFDLRQYDAHYQAFLDTLPAGPINVLDLACGPGSVSAYVKARRAEARVVAADRSEAMLEQVRARVAGVSTRNVDCRDLSGLERDFHGVVFFFGLSYFDRDDAARVLAEIHSVLLPGGSLLLASVAGEPAESGAHTSKSGDRVFSFLRRPSEIVAMVGAAGFEVVGSSTIDSPANASWKSTDAVVLARKPRGG
jgi:ubiquinone/menaquinone biosynthesis C-methylase UbiE